jgi:hypothetical protein
MAILRPFLMLRRWCSGSGKPYKDNVEGDTRRAPLETRVSHEALSGSVTKY